MSEKQLKFYGEDEVEEIKNHNFIGGYYAGILSGLLLFGITVGFYEWKTGLLFLDLFYNPV